MRPKLDLSVERWTVSTKELAHVLSVDVGNVARLAKEGMPKIGHAKWHLPDCVRWFASRAQEKAEEVDLDLGKRKAMLYESQEQKNRIEIATKLAQLIPSDEVEAYLATLAQRFVDSLESIPSRLDAPAPIIAAVESEIRAARRDLADSLRDAEKCLRAPEGDPRAAE